MWQFCKQTVRRNDFNRPFVVTIAVVLFLLIDHLAQLRILELFQPISTAGLKNGLLFALLDGGTL